MATSQLSPSFKKFAGRTNQGSYDKARTAERVARGIPYSVGSKGTGVVSGIRGVMQKDRQTGEEYPICSVEITIETPEAMRGRKLSGAGLQGYIRDTTPVPLLPTE